MATGKSKRTYRIVRVELAAFDREGDPILLAMFRGVTPAVESLERLVRVIRIADPPIPLGMMVDPEWIRFFRDDGSSPPSPVLTLGTVETLRHYRPNLGEWSELGMSADTAASLGLSRPQISSFAMRYLIATWLEDLARRWQRTPPPAVDLLTSIGLLPGLEGGTVKRRARLVCHRLR